MQPTKCIISITGRRFMTTAKSIANHYNVLGVTPSATQLEIKAAYYKLSKLYHPDVNNDAAAAIKFREINEAYEVIGNVKLKRLYDRGGFNRKDYRSSHHESEDGKKYTFRSVKPRTPGVRMETIYDFDAWTKEHYGKTFERQFVDKKTTYTKKNYIYHTEDNSNALMGGLIVCVMCMFTLFYVLENDLDSVKNNSSDRDR